jgi:predicted AAA+ superfamily ATPase
MGSLTALSMPLTLSAPTIRGYFDILEMVYLVQRVPAWSSGATSRVTGAPKLLFIDSGLAASLRTGDRDGSAAGGLP